MSLRYPAGLINGSPVTAAYPSGVWTPSQTNVYNSQNVWQYDQYWRNTTLLLHGDGTNGAQNNTFLDSSSNNFTITRNGNTTQGSFTPYEPNGYWSNYFDGNGDYLTVANNTALDMGTGDFTLEFWLFSVDASQNTQWRRFVCTGANGSESIQVGHLGNSSGTISYTADDTAPTTITSTTVVLNKWAHIAVVRQSGTVKLYVNGVSEGTPITDSNSKSSTAFTIGRYPGLNGFTNGYISNVRLVKGTAVYTSNFTPTTTPFTAINGTSLLTCQSNRFIDNSTNAFAITRNGDTSVQAFQPFPGATTWSASVLGGSGYFDGSGDYLTTAQSANLAIGTSDFCIEYWVYSLNTNEITPFGQWAAGNADWILQYRTGPNQFRFYYNSSNDLSGNYTMVPNQWTHVAVCRSGSTMSLYVNGTRLATKTDTTSINNGRGLTIGVNPDGPIQQTNGYITDTRIVVGSSVYTPSSSTLTVPTAPLTAISNTKFLCGFTNAGIFDNAQMSNLETVGNAQVSTSVVKYGTGSFSGASGGWALTNPNPNLEFGGGDFTIEFWWYPTSTSRQALYHGSWGTDWSIGIDYSSVSTNETIGVWASSNGTSWNLINSDPGGNGIGSIKVIQNAWNHIAFVRNGTTWRCFVNGVAGLTLTGISGSIVNRATSQKCIGVWWSNSNAPYSQTGYFDDFRITKGVARYVTSFTPPIARMPNQ